MRTRTLFVFALVFVVAFAASGCRKASEKAAEEVAEKAAESATGADVEVDDEKVTVTGEDGESVEVQSGSQGLPEGFPADVPVYDGTIESSGRIETGGTTNYTVTIATEDGQSDVFDWYKGEFERRGWKKTGEFSASDSQGQTAMLAYEKGRLTVAVGLTTESEDRVIISCTVTEG